MVAVLSSEDDSVIVGSGCLIDSTHILTCRHVVEAATGGKEVGAEVQVRLCGLADSPKFTAKVSKVETRSSSVEDDLALLVLKVDANLQVESVEFASPLRHAGKAYSVLGFPDGDTLAQGRNARGLLHAADAKGLVQMDRTGAQFVRGGFSGAPVWCSELDAFVGIVVTELSEESVSWCIPSRRLCHFFPALRVRFRVPPSDRPIIHDYEEDDPNVQLFGTLSDDGEHRLTATVVERAKYYVVEVAYECLGGVEPRGHYVTFVTYPDFDDETEDAYELFAIVENGRATQRFRPGELFTVAAVGDAGDTALTLNLVDSLNLARPPKKRRSR
ncbi:MAG: serine protease [Byssovorax sp.]